MPSNRYLTLMNLVCASCVLVLDIVNLFLEHVYPSSPFWYPLDLFFYFDAPLLLCAIVIVMCLLLYFFAHKNRWQIGIAIVFELTHVGLSISDANQYVCVHTTRYCANLRRLLVSLFNILLLTGGVVSQSVALYRQRTHISDNDDSLLIYDTVN